MPLVQMGKRFYIMNKPTAGTYCLFAAAIGYDGANSAGNGGAGFSGGSRTKIKRVQNLNLIFF